MPFSYVPDYRDSRDLTSKLKDVYFRLFGIPFISRRIEARFLLSEFPKTNAETRILDGGCGDGLFTI